MDKSLEQLIHQLTESLEQLRAGDLSFADIDPMVDGAREVYERLIALRYAAAERELKGEVNAEESADAPFKITTSLPGQTSLIDAIEEVVRTNGGSLEREVGSGRQAEESTLEEDAPVSEHEAADAQVHENGMPGEDAKAIVANEEDVTETDEEAAEAEAEAPQEPLVESVAKKEARSESPKANTSGKGGSTLAERLRKTPIEDLRKAIGLNQKFQYINELFSGDSEGYHLLIDEVNSADSLDRAMALLAARSERFATPDEEDQLAQSLLELVERRFL